MEKARLVIAAILTLTTSIFSSAIADPYLSGTDSIEISESSREYLDGSGHVLRYRFVAIDSKLLQASLSDSAGGESAEGPATVELTMFDDVTLVVRVIAQKKVGFKVLVSPSDATCESDVDDDGSNGSLEFTRLGHVTARFWVCDQIYTIGTMRDLAIPYHVVSMLDPNNLPNID